MKRISFFTLFLIMNICVNAQTKIIGRVLSKESNLPLYNATIKLNKKQFTLSDKKGRFVLNNINQDSISIQITHIGYKKTIISYKINKKKKKQYLPIIKVESDIIEIGEINVNGEGVLEKIKGDTTEYNVGLLKMDKYDSAKELLEAIPGVYRNKNGELIIKGKCLKLVTINGKYLYRNKVDENLEAIPADLVSKIQVYDDISELARFCGFDYEYNQNCAVNLVTKFKNLKLSLGKYSASAGNKNRYKLSGENTFLMGNSNANINETISNVPINLIGFYNKAFPKQYNSIFVKSALANQNKISDLFVDGTYNDVQKDVESTKLKDFIYEDRVIKEKNETENNSLQKRVDNTMDFKLNRKNKIYIRNEFNQNDTHTKTKGELIQYLNANQIANSIYETQLDSESKKIYNNIISRSILNTNLYLQLDLSSQYSETKSRSFRKGILNGKDDNHEQIKNHKDHKIEFKPTLVYRKNSDINYVLENSLKLNMTDIKDNALNYQLDYLINKFAVKSSIDLGNRGGVRYNIGIKTIKALNNSIDNEHTALIGGVNLFFLFNKKNGLEISYNRNTESPKYYHIFDYYDNNNSLFYRVGNKNLKHAITNNFLFCPFHKRLKLFKYSFGFTLIDNNISNNVFFVDSNLYKGMYLKKGTQISEYDNLNNYWETNFKISFQLPIYIDFNYSFSNIPTYYNAIKTKIKSNKLNLKLSYKYYRNKNYVFDFYSSSNYSFRKNSINNNLVKSYYLDNKLELTLKNIVNSVLKISYRNFVSYSKIKESYSDIRHFLNLSVRKSFFKKKISTKFEIFDVLNNDNFKIHKAADDYIINNQTNMMSRYFMFSLYYSFKNASSGIQNKYKYRNKFKELKGEDNF